MARQRRPYTTKQYLAMMRVDKFKNIRTAELQGGFFKRGDTGGFSGPIANETGGGVMVNLYTNPRDGLTPKNWSRF